MEAPHFIIQAFRGSRCFKIICMENLPLYKTERKKYKNWTLIFILASCTKVRRNSLSSWQNAASALLSELLSMWNLLLKWVLGVFWFLFWFWGKCPHGIWQVEHNLQLSSRDWKNPLHSASEGQSIAWLSLAPSVGRCLGGLIYSEGDETQIKQWGSFNPFNLLLCV